MSMGLRGAVIFGPLLCALCLPGRVGRKYAVAAIVLGPLAVLVFGVWKVIPVDSLFIGIGVSLAVLALGIRRKRQ